MMNWPFIKAQVNFLKGLLNPQNDYSMKRWNAMKISDVMLILTIVDTIFNDFTLRLELYYGWIGASLALHGITTWDKRIDSKKEVEMIKANKELDLNVQVETKKTNIEEK